MADDLGQAFVEIRADLSKLASDLNGAKDRVASATSEMESKTRTMGQRIKDSFRNVNNEAKGFSQGLSVAMAGVGVALLAVGGKAVQMAGEFEQTEVAFTTLLGSGQEAQAFLSNLADFAAKTPFDLKGLQGSSRQLLAFGFEANNVIPIMTTLGNAVSAMGGGAVEIDRATTALGQMQAKGKLSTEELLQLTELGIPAFQILQEELGLTGEQLEKSLRTGSIEASVGIQALLAGMDARFKGSMEAQSKTFLGTWSNIQDNFGQIMIRIGQSIIEGFNLQPILEKVEEFTSRFREALEKGNLRQALSDVVPPWLLPTLGAIAGAIVGAMVPAFMALIPLISAVVVGLAPFLAVGALVGALAFLIVDNWDVLVKFFKNNVMPVFKALTPLWQSIKSVLTSIWNTIRNSALEIWAEIKELIGGNMGETKSNIQIILGAIQAFWNKWGNTIMKVTSILFGQIGNIIKTAINIIKNVITLFLNVFQGDWKGAWESIKGIEETAMEFIKNSLKNVFNLIKNSIIGQALIGIVNDFKKRFDLIKQIITIVWNFISGMTREKWNSIKSFLSSVWNSVKNSATSIFNAVKSFFSTTFSSIKNNIKSNFNSVRSFLSSIWNSIRSLGSSFIGRLRSSITGGFNGIKSSAVSVFNSVRSSISSIWNSISSRVRSVVNSMSSRVKSAFNSMKNGVVGSWRGITSGIKSAINSAVRAVNKFIRGLNSQIGKINKVPGVNLPRISTIPMLQEGGNILAGGLALVGEAGPELLELPRGARVSPLMGGSEDIAGQGGGKTINLIQNMDVKASPADIQMFIERGLRKSAMSLGFF